MRALRVDGSFPVSWLLERSLSTARQEHWGGAHATLPAASPQSKRHTGWSASGRSRGRALQTGILGQHFVATLEQHAWSTHAPGSRKGQPCSAWLVEHRVWMGCCPAPNRKGSSQIGKGRERRDVCWKLAPNLVGREVPVTNTGEAQGHPYAGCACSTEGALRARPSRERKALGDATERPERDTDGTPKVGSLVHESMAKTGQGRTTWHLGSVGPYFCPSGTPSQRATATRRVPARVGHCLYTRTGGRWDKEDKWGWIQNPTTRSPTGKLC